MAGMKVDRQPKNESGISREDQELIGKCNAVYKSYNDGTFKYRRQWYLNDNFYEGRHFVWWRKSTGTIDRIQPPKGMVLRSIPKASKAIDVIQNLILANDPRWVVYPEKDMEGNIGKEQEGIAKRSAEWLDFQWDRLNMREELGSLVHFALKFPFSFIQVGFDTDIWVEVLDAFDIEFQPEVKTIYDSPVLIKTINKNIIDVHNNLAYNENRTKVVPTNRYTIDDMKDLRLVEKFGYHRTKDTDDTCMLKEYYFKEYVDGVDKDGEKIKEIKIRIVTIANESILLRNELTEMTEYPFVMYAPKSGSLFQPAWLERMIPVNKSIDLITSNIETFFHIMNRGYWIKHKNANVTRIMNESGQFIEWDVVKPEQATLASIPAYVFAHMANLERWISEQSVSSATMGQSMKGVKAYKAIEAAKQSDFAQMGTSINRLETVIEKVAEVMLDYAERYYKEPRHVYRLHEEKPDYFDVVGANFRGESTDAIPLKASYKVDVSIESGLAYTEEGKRQTMLELYSAGLVPADKVLEMFKFSNVGELIRAAQADKQVSMIDTQDFKALDPQIQQLALQDLMKKNITMPQNPQPEKMQFRQRSKRNTGK